MLYSKWRDLRATRKKKKKQPRIEHSLYYSGLFYTWCCTVWRLFYRTVVDVWVGMFKRVCCSLNHKTSTNFSLLSLDSGGEKYTYSLNRLNLDFTPCDIIWAGYFSHSCKPYRVVEKEGQIKICFIFWNQLEQVLAKGIIRFQSPWISMA